MSPIFGWKVLYLKNKKLSGYTIFLTCNNIFLIILALVCLLPFIHMIAVSFSNSIAVDTGQVSFWPVNFTTTSYEYVLKTSAFGKALLVSIERVTLGVPFSMLLTIMIAYPLSKESRVFFGRTFYVWFFVLTILFGGGLIPFYIVVAKTGLVNSLLSLVIPSSVQVFNVLILMNFFRQLPKEIEEAAFIDGAGQMAVMWRIYVPLSKPALATLVLFTIVYHWNSWFDGLIFMNLPDKYPLQTYLQNIVSVRNMVNISADQVSILTKMNNSTQLAVQIILASIPILIAYPFLQRYFAKGIVLGSVKG